MLHCNHVGYLEFYASTLIAKKRFTPSDVYSAVKVVSRTELTC